MNDAHTLLWAHSPALAAHVHRIAAAANCPVLHRQDDAAPPSVNEWCGATTVVVDAAAAATPHARDYPHRAGVVLVADTSGPHPDDGLLLPDREVELVRLLSAARSTTGPLGATVAFVGGRGGAGASFLAAAVALSHPGPALLMDLDPLGGGADILLGAEATPGARWPDLRLEQGRVPADTLWQALPQPRPGLAVLSGARPDTPAAITAQAVRVVLGSSSDAGALTVCDLPRAVTEPAAAALGAAHLTAVVVPTDLHSCCAAAAVVAAIAPSCQRVALVTRPAPYGLSTTEVEDLVGTPVLATMPEDRRLARRAHLDGLRLGRASPVAAVARTLLDAVRSGAA